jgi:subtilase family serine protease
MNLSARVRFYGIAVLLIVGCCVAAFAQAPERVTRSIDDNEVVTKLGNVHPLARAEFEQGAVSGELRLERMILNLEPSAKQEAELDALLAEQYDSASPLYHQWLTPAQFGARFGVSPSDLGKITRWLTAHGMTVDEIPAGNRQIIFSGTVAQVAEAFHTEIRKYQVNGATHIANAQDPQIPAALASVVGGVVSLHDFRRNSAIRTRQALAAAADSKAQWTSGSSHYLMPKDWATIYDTASLINGGTTGSGVTIALVGRSNINLSDVTLFRSTGGLSANTPSVVFVSSNPGLVSGDQDESTLDVEWAGATAPGATVKLVAGATTQTSDGVDLSAQYIVNNKIGQIISTSYGSCESDMGSTELAFYNNLWKQAATQGQSALVSSGDAGAAGCNSGSDTSGSVAGVNGLCSSPYSTCVGGTEFNEGSGSYWSASNGSGYESALSYIPEKVWNESALDGGSGLWASGGGVSKTYAQPSWQTGISGISAANGMRAVPDVAFTAASHDGYVIVEDGSYYIVGGTSAASPSFAGMLALLMQAKGGTALGSVNSRLYGLTSASVNPFHATPGGNNSVTGVTGFSATGSTYNLATGLGSIDGSKLVSAWGNTTASSGVDLTLTPSATSGSVQTGNSISFTITASESGSASNSILLTASTLSGASVSISPTVITPGVTAKVTITTTSAMAAGTNAMTFTGTDSTGSRSFSYTLTTTQAPTLALSAGSSALTILPGASTTLTLTATTGGSYTGNLTYTVNGLPSGVTPTWSLNPASGVSGSASSIEKLSLAALSTVAGGSSQLTITVTGDGLSASVTVPLTVQVPASLAVTPANSTVTLVSGSSVTDGMKVTVNSTFTGSVQLNVSGLPNGVTASWSANPVTPSNLTVTPVLTLKAASGLTASSTALTIMATGDGLTAKQQVTLQLEPAPALTVSPQTSSVSVLPGSQITNTIQVAGNVSFSGTVLMSITGLPAGVSASWNPSSFTMTGSGSSSPVLTLKTTSAAVPASTTLTVTATCGSVTASKTFTLQVLPTPTLTMTPASTALTVTQGSSVTDLISLNGNSTYTGAVTLATSSLSTVFTSSWTSSSVTLSNEAGSSTLTIKAPSSVTPGSYSFTITATGDGLTVSKQITLTVKQAPGVQLSSTATTVAMSHTSSAALALTSSMLGGLSSSVSFSVSGLPAGVTSSFSSSSIAAPGSGNVTLTLKGSSSARAGTSTITVTETTPATNSTTAYTSTKTFTLTLQ